MDTDQVLIRAKIIKCFIINESKRCDKGGIITKNITVHQNNSRKSRKHIGKYIKRQIL